MKEQDAKKKRCCGPAPERTGVWVTTSVVPADGYYACSDSECMAWNLCPDKDEHKGEGRGYCGHIK